MYNIYSSYEDVDIKPGNRGRPRDAFRIRKLKNKSGFKKKWGKYFTFIN